MTEKLNPGSPIAGIAKLLIAGAAFDYFMNDGQHIAQAINFYHQLQAAMTPAPVAANNVAGVAPALSQSANVWAGVFLIGVTIAVGLRWMGKRINRHDATAPAPGVTPIKRNRGRLPRKFPADICTVVEDVLATRGGTAEDGGPKFWVERDACIATPLFWRLAVDYAPGAEPAALERMVININDRLIRKDLDADVIIDPRPLSVVISNPKPPTFTLADYWPMIAALPQDELYCAGSVMVEGGQMVLNRLQMAGEGAGTLIAGRPGAGKTQFALSTLLSFCMANSPRRLTLFIIDLKKLDTMHLAGLPHLVAPIATEIDQAIAVLGWMQNEMLRRSRVSDTDRSWEDQAIALYVDELAVLLSLAGDSRATIVEMLSNLARMGRALGIIVIGCTQRVVEVENEAFENLSRRCVLRCAKITDSNHAIGAKETNGHKLPKGAVSIHDAGDGDGELTRGLFVGETKNGFDRVIAPFLADIQKRYAGINPAWTMTPPSEPEAVDDPAIDDAGNNDNDVAGPDLVALAMDQLTELREKLGDDLIAAWVGMALEGDLTTNAIRKAARKDGVVGKRIRDEIESVTTLVKNTHVFDSSV